MAEVNILAWYKVLEYLESIGFNAEVDKKRTHEIFSEGVVLCPEELTTVFISNYKETEGKEQFKDLWLFSDNYVIEVLNFIKQETPKLEIAIFSKNICTASFESNNFDLSQKATDDSTLKVTFYTLSDFSCFFVASGHNCNALMSIYLKYVKNNIVRGQTTQDIFQTQAICSLVIAVIS